MFTELAHESSARSSIDRMLDIDVNSYLPGDLLVKMDIASMAHSLEARSPLLDHHFMGIAAQLPTRAKARRATTKIILKDVLRPIVPGDILDRPKWGFSIPLADWLRGPLRHAVRETLLDERARSRGIFRAGVAESLLTDHLDRGLDRASELWLLFMLELWHRRFVDGLDETALTS